MVEIVHQVQSMRTSCMSACLAMILARPVTEVESDFHALYQAQKVSPFEYLRKWGVGLRTLASDEQQAQNGFLYLVSAPSLNMPAIMHSILIDCRGDITKVYDPMQGWADKNFYVTRGTKYIKGAFEIGGFVLDAEINHAPHLGIYRG